MSFETQNIMFKSTYQILLQKVAEIKRKLTDEIPQVLRQAYETGGQWHDNPGWDYAMAEQSTLNRILREIIIALQNPVFSEDLSVSCEKITVGTEVETRDLDTGEIEVFKIVGPLDIIYNPQYNGEGFLSFKSPIGRSLLGKGKGRDEVVIKLPMSTKRLLILEIKQLVLKET